MRPSWDDYFMRIAYLAATRSQCHSRQVGAVIVRERHIIATGYNGVPSGIRPCKMCKRKDCQTGKGYSVCPAVHAESNALAQAAKLGVSTLGATIYCTTPPCKDCAGLIINAGLRTLVSPEVYVGSLAGKLFRESGMGMVIQE
jgi:dCMP deaminase